MNWFGWKNRCQQLETENQRLRERNAWLEQQLQESQAQNTRLTQSLAAAKKHSGNSSKPPSSDIVKLKGQGRKPKSKRRIGGQLKGRIHASYSGIRDVKYLCEFPDLQVQRYGKRLLEGLKALFWTLHRKDQLNAQAFESELGQAHEQIWEAAIPTSSGPFHRLVWNMAERFAKHGEAYFQFITTPAIDPTNNVVEQAMRFVAIDRHVTQGTRSAQGRQICERLWTVMATCALHKRSPFQWICQAINAHFKGLPAPSSILDTS